MARYVNLNANPLQRQYPDAILAIKVISEAKNIKHREMADLCGLKSDSGITGALNKRNAVMQQNSFNVTRHASDRSGDNRNTSTIVLQNRDLTKLAKFLGEKCNNDFSTVTEMITYAQQNNYPLPEGRRWSRLYVPDATEDAQNKKNKKQPLPGITIPAPSGADDAQRSAAPKAQLPHYKAAALLIMEGRNESSEDWLPNDPKFSRYLNIGMSDLKPKEKLEKIQLLAKRLGEALGQPEMDADAMLAYAQEKWPGQIPDIVLPLTKSGGRNP